ncbi:MAG: bifunctional oligoribonuclease/PAP phosphatase NrnA [Clostridia bacterium]|nr:bifunctional oligoribonuclease/PAP phosphatase NrnA [Clostridia bacterium]
MNEAVKKSIIDKIEEYDTIILSRHKRPDGDAVGSTLGLAEIIRASFPGKRVFLDNADRSEYVSFLGDEGPKPTDDDYNNALVIVLDTGGTSRVANDRFNKGAYLIKIDHHIIDDEYGDIAWIEEERSSVCEMIADLYVTNRDRLKLPVRAAECIYAGMVTDSGRFRFRGTTGDTMRLAATLIDAGIDMESIYAQLGSEEYETLRFRASLISKIKLTENGVAYLRISNALRKRHRISQEEASNSVSLMEHIKGSLIWLAFIENDDKSIRVRLRSRFVEVQPLASRYHGGGHACASGATVYSREEEAQLIAKADGILKKFKKEHPGLI